MFEHVKFIVIYSAILVLVQCWKEIDYDKDGDLSLDELVRKYAPPGLIHYDLLLSDGYILKIDRLKREGAEKLKPILLLHGLTGCSDSFFLDKNKSVPLLLASQGYDIWFMNNRGSRNSENHVKLNSKTDAEYWNFSWEEIGLIDMPATIDLVLKNNIHNKVALVGHSEGSFDIFVGLSQLPEYNEKVAISFHWGGAAYHSTCKQEFIGVMCIYNDFIKEILDKVGLFQIIPTDGLRKTILAVCRLEIFTGICRDVINQALRITNNAFGGFRDISFIFTKWPCGGSTKELMHFLQTGVSGRFARFDYGKKMNRKVYNSTLPPRFHLERITSPTAIFCGLKDPYCTETDIEQAEAEVPNVVFTKIMPDFAHIDFILGEPFKRHVYEDMMKLLKKYH